MMAELRPYPKYKDSGMPGLGELPEHWEVRRNGRLFAQRNETGFGDLPILEVSLKTGVRVRDMENMKRKQVMSDREKYKRAVQGDIAYNMMRMWQGALGAGPVDGLVSPAYVVARPLAGTDTRYFSYLFRTPAYMAEVDGYSRGIVKDRNRLYWEDFKRMPSCFPPLEEQAAIADYLDANAVLVRKYIRNRRRLIEVLSEQKQAIINQAVTRGLDPNVPLKPSGIDGLGHVPDHWQSVRLGRATDLVTGYPFKSSGFTVNPTGIRLLRGINVSPGRIRWDSVVRWPIGEDTALSTFALAEGDIVFGMDRPLIRSGVRVAIVRTKDVPSLLLQRVARLRAKGDLDQKFLFLLFQDRRYAEYLAPLFSGISVPHISPTQISDYRVALPPITEQLAILDHVDKESHSIVRMIEHAEREIALIREYRTRLIADVVTGKLDVREAVWRLAENVDEGDLGLDELFDEEGLLDDVDLDTEPEEVEA